MHTESEAPAAGAELSSRHSREPRHNRDFPPKANAPTILYRLFDAGGQLLYVGITGNKANRWQEHSRYSRWWRQVARKELTTYPNRALALDAERTAVLDEQPKYNIEHTAPTERRVIGGITLYADHLKRLDEYREATSLSRSAAIRRLIEENL